MRVATGLRQSFDLSIRDSDQPMRRPRHVPHNSAQIEPVWLRAVTGRRRLSYLLAAIVSLGIGMPAFSQDESPLLPNQASAPKSPLARKERAPAAARRIVP